MEGPVLIHLGVLQSLFANAEPPRPASLTKEPEETLRQLRQAFPKESLITFYYIPTLEVQTIFNAARAYPSRCLRSFLR